MTDVIGRAVIEIVPDFSKFRAQVHQFGQQASQDLSKTMAKGNAGKALSDSVKKGAKDADAAIKQVGGKDAFGKVTTSAQKAAGDSARALGHIGDKNPMANVASSAQRASSEISKDFTVAAEKSGGALSRIGERAKSAWASVSNGARQSSSTMQSEAKKGAAGHEQAAGRATAGWLSAAKKIGAGLGAAFLVNKATHFVKESVKDYEAMGTSVLKTTRMTGASAEDASRLAFVFKYMNLNEAQANKALIFLSKNMNKAASSSDKAMKKTEALNEKYRMQAMELRSLPKLTDAQKKKLMNLQVQIDMTGKAMKNPQMAVNEVGVAVRDATGKLRPIKDVLIDTAEAFKNMEGGAEKNGLALKIFGRSGTDLLPVLNKGAAGINELMKKSDEFGITMSGPQLEAVKNYKIAQKDMKFAWEGLKHTLGESLLPVLTKLFTVMTTHLVPAVKAVRDWIKTSLAPAMEELWKKIEPIITGVFRVAKSFYDWLASINALKPVIVGIVAAVVAYKAVLTALAIQQKIANITESLSLAGKQAQRAAALLGIGTKEAETVATEELTAAEQASLAASEAMAAAAGELSASLSAAVVGAEGLAGATEQLSLADEIAADLMAQYAATMDASLLTTEAAAAAAEQLVAAREEAAIVSEQLAIAEGLISEAAATAAAAMEAEIAAAAEMAAVFEGASVAAGEMAVSEGVVAAGAGVEVAAMEGVTVATAEATVATEGFTAALLANPVGLIVGAVIALGVAFVVAYKKIKPFHDAVDAFGRLLKEGFFAAIDLVKRAWGAFTDSFRSTGEAIMGFLGRFKDIFSTVFSIFKGDIGIGAGIGKIKDQLIGALSDIPKIIGNAFGGLSSLYGKADEFIAGLFDRLVSATKNIPLLGPLIQGIKSQVGGWLGAFSGLFKIGEGIFTLDMGKIKEGVGKIFSSIKDAFFGGLRAIGNYFSQGGKLFAEFGPKIGGWLAQAGKWVGGNLPKIFDWLKKIPAEIFKIIGGLFGGGGGGGKGGGGGGGGGGAAKKAGDGFGTILKKIVVDGFGGMLKGLGGLAAGLGTALWALFKGALNILFIKVPGLLLNLVGQLGTALVKMLASAFMWIWHNPGKILNGLYQFFIGIPLKIAGWLKLGDLAGKLLGWIADGFMWIVRNTGKVLLGLGKWLLGLPGKILGFLGNLGLKLVEWFLQGFVWVVKNGAKLLANIGAWLVTLPFKMIAFLINFGAQLYEWMKSAWQFIVDKGGDILSAVVSWVASIPGKLLDGLQALGSMLWNWMKAAWDWLATNGPTLIASVIGFVVSIPGRIISGLASLGSMLWNWMKSAWDWLVTNGAALIGGFMSFVTSIPGRIISGLGSLGSTLWGWIKGAFDWVATMAPKAISGLVGFFSSLPGRLMDALGAAISGLGKLAGKIGDIGGRIWDTVKGFIRAKILIPIADTKILGGKPFDFVRRLLADGDIITGPTQAIIGEAGPEVRVPLSDTKTLSDYVAGRAKFTSGVVNRATAVTLGQQPEVVLPLSRPARAKELAAKALGMTGAGRAAAKMQGIPMFAKGGIFTRTTTPVTIKSMDEIAPPKGFVEAMKMLDGYAKTLKSAGISMTDIGLQGGPGGGEFAPRTTAQHLNLVKALLDDGYRGTIHEDGSASMRKKGGKPFPLGSFFESSPNEAFMRAFLSDSAKAKFVAQLERVHDFFIATKILLGQGTSILPKGDGLKVKDKAARKALIDAGFALSYQPIIDKKGKNPDGTIKKPTGGYWRLGMQQVTKDGLQMDAPFTLLTALPFMRAMAIQMVMRTDEINNKNFAKNFNEMPRVVQNQLAARPYEPGSFQYPALMQAELLGRIGAFADGGVLTGPQIALVGEAGDEVVIPLTRPGRAAALVAQSGLFDVLSKTPRGQQLLGAAPMAMADGGYVDAFGNPAPSTPRKRRAKKRGKAVSARIRTPKAPAGYATDAFGNLTRIPTSTKMRIPKPPKGYVYDINGDMIPAMGDGGVVYDAFGNPVGMTRNKRAKKRKRPILRRALDAVDRWIAMADGGVVTDAFGNEYPDTPRRKPRKRRKVAYKAPVRIPKPPAGYVTDAFGNLVRKAPSRRVKIPAPPKGYVYDFDGGLVPARAMGGVFDSPTMSLIGEAGPEAVIPLSRPGRAAQLVRESGLIGTVAQADPAAAAALGTAAGAPDGGILGGGPGNTYIINGISLAQVMAEIAARDEAAVRVRR